MTRLWPNPVTGGSGASTMTVSTLASTPAGTYTVTITGTSGSVVHNATVTLFVQTAAAGDFTLSSVPTSATISARQSATYAISVNPANGFNSAVTFSLTGLPPRTSGSFSPASSTTGTTLTVKANPSAKPTSATTLTITGTGGGLTRTVQVTITIQ